MPTYWGDKGTVKVAGVTVAEIVRFEVNSEVEPVDDTAMRDPWRTHIPGSGIKKWSGTIEYHYDPSDANGQELIVEGASLALGMYPIGTGATSQYMSGTASVTKLGMPVPMEGETLKRTAEILGNGALSRAVV